MKGKHLLFIAIAAIILFLLVFHSGPWIFPRHMTLRVVVENGHPLAGAKIRVKQKTWSLPCIAYMGSSSASCGSGDWTVFDGRLNQNGEASVLVFQAAGMRAEPYVACIDGKIYEGYGAYAEWPSEADARTVTLDYEYLKKMRSVCVTAPGVDQLATPSWWGEVMSRDPESDSQEDNEQP